MNQVKATHGCTPTPSDRRRMTNPAWTSFGLAPPPSSFPQTSPPPCSADDGVFRSSPSLFSSLSFTLFCLQPAALIYQSMMVLSAGATSESCGCVFSLCVTPMCSHIKQIQLCLGWFIFCRRHVDNEIKAVLDALHSHGRLFSCLSCCILLFFFPFLVAVAISCVQTFTDSHT